jgi:hypothetical protein
MKSIKNAPPRSVAFSFTSRSTGTEKDGIGILYPWFVLGLLVATRFNIIHVFLRRKVPGQGSNPRPTATPPSTNHLSQIAIHETKGSLDSGIQARYLCTRHVANSGEATTNLW